MNWFPYDNGLRHGRVKKVFVLIQQKKNTSLGNSDYRADQKAVRYDDDNTLEILRANLELKHMFIICSYNTGPYVEKGKTGGVKSENIKIFTYK